MGMDVDSDMIEIKKNKHVKLLGMSMNTIKTS